MTNGQLFNIFIYIENYQDEKMKKIISILFQSLLLSLFFNTLLLANIDVKYYSLDLEVYPHDNNIHGSLTMKAVPTVAAVENLRLDLYDNMQVDSITGAAFSYQHSNDEILIELDKSYPVGEQIEVTIFYQGEPNSGNPFTKPMVFQDIYGKRMVCTESCPYYARCWWPCKDEPSDKPDSMDFRITMPSEYKVAANGVRISIEQNENDTRTHHWKIKNPIATYLVTFSAYEYSEMSDIYVSQTGDTLPLMYFILPRDSSRVARQIKKVPNMIDILTDYYGPYPFMNEKYGMAEYAGAWAAMEYQTMSCFTSAYIADEETILHELSHQWWGDCVSPANFHSTWLSEGFAVLSEALYWGAMKGQDHYHDHMNSLTWAFDDQNTLYLTDLSTPQKVYPTIVYHKGAWVLHMLRYVVGDSLFWECLEEYRNQFQYASAVTEDLCRACETVYGESLEWFFNQWVYHPSNPKYNYGWWLEEGTNTEYLFKLFIDRTHTDFIMPIDVSVHLSNSVITERVWVNENSAELQLELSEEPTAVILDEQNWVLEEHVKIDEPYIKHLDLTVIDSTGNNNGIAETNEHIVLSVPVINRGVLGENVLISVKNPGDCLEFLTSEYELSQITHNEIKNIYFDLNVKSYISGHFVDVILEIQSDENLVNLDTLSIAVGQPSVLVVDDKNNTSPHYDYSGIMKKANIYSALWQTDVQGLPASLESYESVIWMTGDDRRTSLSSDEQQLIQDYMDDGGNLVLMGSNIGFDLVEDGSFEDSLFYTHTLHSNYICDSTNATIIMWKQNEPLTNGLFLYVNENGVDSKPDVIEPMDGGETIFNWVPGYTCAGFKYENPLNQAKLVYFPFSLSDTDEPIPGTFEKLFENIYEWFIGPTHVADELYVNNSPASFRLWQNYPNPFNSSTEIKYQIPVDGHVKIEIIDLLGRHVKTLVQSYKNAGAHQIAWDGSNDYNEIVSSGVYIYKMDILNYKESNKLLFLK